MSDEGVIEQAAAHAAQSDELAPKVAFLSGLRGPGDDAVETHFAWVFLVGTRAWKLRKPARRDTMDYSTLAARRHDSEEEVRLNRRLAPDVYLGTRALTRDDTGRFAIDGTGRIVDWLVEMRRLDRGRMLDVVLRRGLAGTAELEPVVALLAAFYSRESPAIRRGAELRARLHGQVAANHDALQDIEPQMAGTARDLQLAFLGQRPAWFEARAASGCVVEAHGDLRPEHVVVDEPAAVIDCLEFDRNLRILDRAEELGFLELECARFGHALQGRWLRQECLQRLGDDIPTPLLLFYRSHRAATRAKLYAWRAGEPDDGTPEAWRATARSYLAAAIDDLRQAGRC